MEHLISHDFKGVISIEQNRKWIYKQAIGEADRPGNRPNRLETRFPIAGGSQVFTAVGILKLIEKKQLGYGDKIGELLPYPLGNIDKSITIRQLLNHTSGLGDYYEEKKEGDFSLATHNFSNAYLRNPRDFLPLVINLPMKFQPGTAFSYSHAGYVLLNLILEKVSGMPFDIYLKRELFVPNEMHDTGYFALDRLPSSCAIGYCFDKREQDYFSNIFSVEAKGAYTTTGDLEKFWLNLSNGKIMGRALVREMFSPQVEEGFYGYGLWLQYQPKEDAYLPFLQGAQPGISFISSFDRQTGRSITLISNYGSDVISLHGQLYSQLVKEEAI